MKDPLHLRKTPYEILGITETAGKKEITTAFGKAVASGGNIREATGARNKLTKTVERALVDLFLYEDSYLAELGFSMETGGRQLAAQRDHLAHAWREQQKKHFPHPASTHSLAVFWYWWALYGEEKKLGFPAGARGEAGAGNQEGFPPCPPGGWIRVITYWPYLIHCTGFWREWAERKKEWYSLTGDDLKSLGQKVETHLKDTLQYFKEQYALGKEAQRFEEYETLLASELKTAKMMRDAGPALTVKGRRIEVYCGRLMLEELDLLEPVRVQIEEAAQAKRDENLERLALKLSPFAHIAALVEQKKYDEALTAAGALPEKDRGNDKVLTLRAAAYREKGRQAFGIGRFVEALNCWKQSMKTGKLLDKTGEVLVSQCRARAVSLQKSDPDTAVEILGRALMIVPDASLSRTLAAIYLQRGINLINNAQSGQNPEKDKVITGIEQGIKDIERAVKLDPASSRAKEQLQVARKLLVQLYLQMGVKQIKEAQKQANADTILSEMETGVNSIEKAAKIDPTDAQAREQLRLGRKMLEEFQWLAKIKEHIEAKEWDTAIEKCKKILEMTPGNNARARQAQQLMQFCLHRQEPGARKRDTRTKPEHDSDPHKIMAKALFEAGNKKLLAEYTKEELRAFMAEYLGEAFMAQYAGEIENVIRLICDLGKNGRRSM